MAEAAVRWMTFEEFHYLPEETTRYELVAGRLAPLMTPDITHGVAQLDIGYYLRAHVGTGFKGILGTEIDFPTIPFHGRRGDIVYLAPEHVSNDDWKRGYPSLPTDLVVEVVSEGDEKRDYQEKLREYALVGIANYWIVDPKQKRVEMYSLQGNGYVLDQRLGINDVLTSSLFPGLKIPLSNIFRY